MSFKVDTVKEWYGTQIMAEIIQARDESLVKIGTIGVQQMKKNISGHRKTGEIEDSIMWRTWNKMSSPKLTKDILYAPKSRRSVVIGSRHGAGEISKRGIRHSIVTSVEYGTTHSGATPFIRPAKRQISSQVKQIMTADTKKVIDKPR